MANTVKDWFKTVYVVLAFFFVLCLGVLKSLVIGPIAALILIIGNSTVILGLSPAHVAWTVYTLFKTNRFDAPLKVAIFLGFPALCALWLALSIAGSVLVGVGYGFFTPLISSFEAFRQEHESTKFLHCIVDGTWSTIKGSCTVVRDFADFCYHSFSVFLKELRENPGSNELQPLRFIHVPACIIVGLIGLIVEIPLYAAIALVKSPFMLFKGWHRLLSDLISREGPFLETACIPIAGLTIIMWPLIVIGSVLLAIFTSIFIGLYGSVVVYQERSFRRGIAYVIAMVAEFDEYTNDWLYLREGSILPKPRYRKRKPSDSTDLSVTRSPSIRERFGHMFQDAPGMLVPTLTSSRSVRETMKELQMVQVWGGLMKSFEANGKELLESNLIIQTDLANWLNIKNSNDAMIIHLGLPSYTFLHNLLHSIKVGSYGIMLMDGTEINHLNRPQDRLLDWFFHPVIVLKEQIRVIQLEEGEIHYLEKILLFGSNNERAKCWENGAVAPDDALRAAQIEGISRRMLGMVKSISKFPTYRRLYRQVVKDLVIHCSEKINHNVESVTFPISKQRSTRSTGSSGATEGSTKSASTRSIGSIEIV